MINLIISHPILSSLAALIGLIIYKFAIKIYILRAQLTPGPFPLPFVGNLLRFRGVHKNFNIILADLVKEHGGDPVTIFTGPTPMVLLSTPESIRENLIDNPHDIQSRPEFGHLILFNRGTQDIALAPYNEMWKQHKKIASRAVKRIIDSEHLAEHVGSAVEEMAELMLAESGPVQLDQYTSSITFSVLMHFCYGESITFDDETLKSRLALNNRLNTDFTAMMMAISSSPGSRYLFQYGSFIPAIRKVQEIFEELHSFNDQRVSEHKQRFKPENPVNDIVDAVLLEQYAMQQSGEAFETMADVHVALLIADIFQAGTETTSTAFKWFFLQMVLNQDVQTKCQEEIDRVIGNRRPSTSDRKSLPYLEACIVETLRMHPPAPIGVPRTASRPNVTIAKHYKLPENVLVATNLYGMHYNEEYFPNPHKFQPERFIGDGGILKPPSWLPFGCGKRICLGEQLGKNNLFLITAGLLQRLTLRAVEGESYDVDPGIDDLGFLPKPHAGFVVEERRV